MIKFLNILLTVTSILFAALYYSSGDQPSTPQIDLETNVENSDLKKENLLLKQEVSKLKKQIDLLQSLPERVIKITETETNDSDTNNLVSDGVATFRKTMEDPAVQAMMKKRRDGMVMGRYKGVLDRLNLSDDEKEKMITLLGDRFLYRMQSFMKMRAAETDEEKEDIRASQEDLNIENENKIADLLGSQYDTYVSYEDKRNEYQILENLNNSEGESSFSQEQTDQLATAMKETSDAFQFSNETIQADPRAYRELSDEDKVQYKLELEQRDELVLAQVSGSLNEEQLEKFKKEQKRNRERLTSSRRGGPPWARRGR